MLQVMTSFSLHCAMALWMDGCWKEGDKVIGVTMNGVLKLNKPHD